MAEETDENVGIHVSFFLDRKLLEAESLKRGQPVYKETELIKIQWIGDAKKQLVAPAHDRSDRYDLLSDRSKVWLTWAQAFPKHYEAFLRGHSYDGDGTSLAELDLITDSRRESLRALNIYTVEDLAALDGPALKRVGMNARDLKNAAIEFLERKKAEEPERLARQQLAKSREEIDLLRAELEDLKRSAVKPDLSKGVEVDDEDTEAKEFFESMEEDDLRNWLTDAGEKPHHLSKKPKLVEMAMELNAKARKAEAA